MKSDNPPLPRASEAVGKCEWCQKFGVHPLAKPTPITRSSLYCLACIVKCIRRHGAPPNPYDGAALRRIKAYKKSHRE